MKLSIWWKKKLARAHCCTFIFYSNEIFICAKCQNDLILSIYFHISTEEDYDAFCLAYMFTYRDFEMGTLGLAWTGDLKNAGGVCEKNGVSVRSTISAWALELEWKSNFMSMILSNDIAKWGNISFDLSMENFQFFFDALESVWNLLRLSPYFIGREHESVRDEKFTIVPWRRKSFRERTRWRSANENGNLSTM